MPDSIHVFAPATVANVTCGFDVLGFAVSQPGDEVVLRKSDKPGLRITAIRGDEGRLPTSAEKNTAGIAILKYLEATGQAGLGLEMELIKKMPLGSGLGSSAASAVAGVFAVNALLDSALPVGDLLPFATEGERLACGAAHADNVAPSLLGGFILVRSYLPLDVVRLHTPADLVAAIVHPDVEVNTKTAREILKKEILMKQAVVQWGNVGGLVSGLFLEDYALIGRSMQDVLVEPVRSLLIPGFQEARAAALQAGALGFGISGSGPSVFALAKGQESAQAAAAAVQRVFATLEIESQAYVSPVNPSGPQIID